MSILDLTEASLCLNKVKPGKSCRMNLRNDDGEDYELGQLINELLSLRNVRA